MPLVVERNEHSLREFDVELELGKIAHEALCCVVCGTQRILAFPVGILQNGALFLGSGNKASFFLSERLSFRDQVEPA